ncbi:hypothetical protein, partial [Rhodobacter sp. NSM]|uniref:hypothetical protein n=1 Tax=Rhodobacter sp. NSM TaxID=3457501 RepID=UPI003FD46BBB
SALASLTSDPAAFDLQIFAVGCCLWLPSPLHPASPPFVVSVECFLGAVAAVCKRIFCAA